MERALSVLRELAADCNGNGGCDCNIDGNSRGERGAQQPDASRIPPAHRDGTTQVYRTFIEATLQESGSGGGWSWILNGLESVIESREPMTTSQGW